MQRSIIVLFVLLSFSICGQKPSRADTPGIEQIIKELYGRYNMEASDEPYVNFEKRKEGWYVVTQLLNKNKLETKKKYLFYNNSIQKYSQLPFAKKENTGNIDPSKYLDDYDLRNFKLQYYYGYKGWYKDVVKELENRKILTDDQLNGLGRAYSSWSLGLLSNQFGDALENEIWDLPLDINCLSEKQIKEFNVLEIKAQQYFKKLSDRNPDYETWVGKIGLKYANEIMFQYTVLLAYANDYAQKMELPAGLYSSEQMDTAREILEHCPPNSIFLSVSDNDYYPLHYLQKKEGVRTDVYIINYSLLGLDRYIYRATFPIYNAAAVKIIADTGLYKADRNELIYLKDSSNVITVNDMELKMRTDTKDDFGRITLKTGRISITKTLDSNIVKMKLSAVVSLEEAKYIYKQQWVLLDILDNLSGRKICFKYGFADELKALNDHITYDGVLCTYDNK